MFDSEVQCQKVVTTIIIGTRIVHYHALTGFDAPELRKLFKPLTPEEVFALSRGDEIYADVGRLRRGRHAVYGWVKARVVEARYVHAERWKITCTLGRRGCVLYAELDGFCGDLSRPDEEELMRLVSSLPQSLHV